MHYRVTISKSAIKILEKVNEPYYSQLKRAIYNLAINPRPKGHKKLAGRNGYRVRVSDYRIIYEIQDDVLVVDVVALGHRKEIYN
jgi:mRNA interferase RelE/StbE